MGSLSDLKGMPVINTAPGAPQSQLLDNLATFSREAGPDVASQYDIQHVVDIYAATQDRDLGGSIIRRLRNPIPTYTQDTIEGFAHTFTGFVLSSEARPQCKVLLDRITAAPCSFDTRHDKGRSCSQRSYDSRGRHRPGRPRFALANIFGDPNVGSFISKQLI